MSCLKSKHANDFMDMGWCINTPFAMVDLKSDNAGWNLWGNRYTSATS